MKTPKFTPLALLLAAPLALNQSACSDPLEDPATNNPSSDEEGLIELRIAKAANLPISQVNVTLADASGKTVHSSTLSLDPNQPSTSALFSLPAGLGYTLKLAANDPNGTTCSGNATFNVVAQQTVQVPLTLRCVLPDSKQDGKGKVKVEIKVESETRECPEISMVSALPNRAKVGQPIKLSSTASGNGVSFQWSASSGTFSAPNQANTTYTCTQAGNATLTLGVQTSPECKKEHSITVQCDHADSKNNLCQEIVSACHGKDPKDGGAISKCHDIGHAGDATRCSAEKTRCLELCNAASLPTRKVTINFEALVGNEAFDCGRSYTGLGSNGSGKASPNDFRFFLHNLALVKADGTEARVTIEDRDEWQGSGVALLDFEGGPADRCFGGSAGTNTKVTGTVAKGDYVGLKFRTGVPTPLNHLDPSTLKAPLSASGMSWSWLSGFKFIKVELGANVLHVGSTACGGTPPDKVRCARSNRSDIMLRDFDPDQDVVIADMAAVFAKSDLSNHQSCHSSGDTCIPLFEAVGLQYKDGSALDTQTLFRKK